ncbi:hypothetical protein WJX77_011557 [Trebouxia sp. C0004]
MERRHKINRGGGPFTEGQPLTGSRDILAAYAQLTKRAASVFVVILPQQQPAVVRVARYPYQEEVHLECANRHLAPELLGVYPTPGGFNQMDVQLLTHPWHSLEPATPALPS